MSAGQVVVGIDVGGERKGFHGVALRDGTYHDRCHATTVEDMVRWCKHVEAQAVGVDAPCEWSRDGHRRAAEGALIERGIQCFATPLEQVAKSGHPFYTWMVNGKALYAELRKYYTLFDGERLTGHVCFETFPHAIACHLADRILQAQNKRVDRLALLGRVRVELPARSGIDWVDAALCALTAHRFLEDDFLSLGAAIDGYIVVPGTPLPAGRVAWRPN